MTPKPQPRIPTITLPKRHCANRACGRELPLIHKYQTCCWACYKAVQAELEAIEKADKEPQERPF